MNEIPLRFDSALLYQNFEFPVVKGHIKWVFKLEMNTALLYQILSNEFWVSC